MDRVESMKIKSWVDNLDPIRSDPRVYIEKIDLARECPRIESSVDKYFNKHLRLRNDSDQFIVLNCIISVS